VLRSASWRAAAVATAAAAATTTTTTYTTTTTTTTISTNRTRATRANSHAVSRSGAMCCIFLGEVLFRDLFYLHALEQEETHGPLGERAAALEATSGKLCL